MNKEKAETWKTVTIIVVTAVLVFSVGYSVFAQVVAGNKIEIASNAYEWSIGFTDAKLKSKTSGAEEVENIKYTNTTASFNINLANVGDSITYEFTVTNSGKLDAYIDSIYIYPESIEDSVIFDVNGMTAGDKIKSGQSITFTLTIRLDNMINLQNQSMLLVIDYKQAN